MQTLKKRKEGELLAKHTHTHTQRLYYAVKSKARTSSTAKSSTGETCIAKVVTIKSNRNKRTVAKSQTPTANE